MTRRLQRHGGLYYIYNICIHRYIQHKHMPYIILCIKLYMYMKFNTNMYIIIIVSSMYIARSRRRARAYNRFPLGTLCRRYYNAALTSVRLTSTATPVYIYICVYEITSRPETRVCVCVCVCVYYSRSVHASDACVFKEQRTTIILYNIIIIT